MWLSCFRVGSTYFSSRWPTQGPSRLPHRRGWQSPVSAARRVPGAGRPGGVWTWGHPRARRSWSRDQSGPESRLWSRAPPPWLPSALGLGQTRSGHSRSAGAPSLSEGGSFTLCSPDNVSLSVYEALYRHTASTPFPGAGSGFWLVSGRSARGSVAGVWDCRPCSLMEWLVTRRAPL